MNHGRRVQVIGVARRHLPRRNGKWSGCLKLAGSERQLRRARSRSAERQNGKQRKLSVGHGSRPSRSNWTANSGLTGCSRCSSPTSKTSDGRYATGASVCLNGPRTSLPLTQARSGASQVDWPGNPLGCVNPPGLEAAAVRLTPDCTFRARANSMVERKLSSFASRRSPVRSRYAPFARSLYSYRSALQDSPPPEPGRASWNGSGTGRAPRPSSCFPAWTRLVADSSQQAGHRRADALASPHPRHEDHRPLAAFVPRAHTRDSADPTHSPSRARSGAGSRRR